MEKKNVIFFALTLQNDHEYDSQELISFIESEIRRVLLHSSTPSEYLYSKWSLKTSLEYDYGDTYARTEILVYRWETDGEFERRKQENKLAEEAKQSRLEKSRLKKLETTKAKEEKLLKLMEDPEYIEFIEAKKKVDALSKKYGSK